MNLRSIPSLMELGVTKFGLLDLHILGYKYAVQHVNKFMDHRALRRTTPDVDEF